MMMVLAKPAAVFLLLLLFLFTAPSTSTLTSPEIPSPTNHSDHLRFNKTCSLYSILNRSCDPHLSSVYFAFSIVYLSFLLLHWISVCFKTKPSFRNIHLLMGALILIKALNLIIYAADNTTKLMSVLHFSIVIHLIVSGWYFVKPFMQNLDKIILMILIPLHLLGNFVNEWFMDVNEMLSLLGIISSGVAAWPVICSTISELRNIPEDDDDDGDYRLSGFRCFYYVVMVNLMAMNILRSIYTALEFEIYSLVFYMVMCYMFRKLFFLIDDHDKKAAKVD